jgi:hypothetical protein
MTIQQLITALKQATGEAWIYEEPEPDMYLLFRNSIEMNIGFTKPYLDTIPLSSFEGKELIDYIINHDQPRTL